MIIDVDKFVASLIKYYCEAYFIDRTSIRCWFDDVLEEQGLEYKDGDIVKTQRRIAAEAKEGIFDDEDEKIRKWLIDWAKAVNWSEQFTITKEQVLDWLEKQGKTFTKKDVDDAYLKGICDAKQELEKQGEQKPILDFKANNWYVSKVDGKIHDLTYNPTDKKELKKLTQSVTKISDKVWSEEDEDKFNKVIDELTPVGECPDYPDWEQREYYYGRDAMIKWLKSIKERLVSK